jgi:hypothetical protein
LSKCGREALKNEAAKAPKGLSSHWKKNKRIKERLSTGMVKVKCLTDSFFTGSKFPAFAFMKHW